MFNRENQKNEKKCCSDAKIISLKARSGVFGSFGDFCGSFGVFCGSFFAPWKQQGIPHPIKGLLQFAKDMFFQTATFSEFWAAKKHHLSCSLILSWAKAHVRLCHLQAGLSVPGKCMFHCGEKCPLSSTVTRLTDEIRLSTKRLVNGFLT